MTSRVVGWIQGLRSALALAAVPAAVAWVFLVAQRGPREVRPGDREVAKRVLVDLAAWDAATAAEHRAAAVWIGSRTQGFAFDRLETFGFPGHRHEIAVFDHDATGLEFSLIPGGTFEMGAADEEVGRRDNEGPRHIVTIAAPFLLCRTETTQRAWQRVMGTNPSAYQGADRPVECVSWNDAREFGRKAGLRLPTEAEWEYACRAGTTTSYWSGDDESDLARVGWYDENSRPPIDWSAQLRKWLGRKPEDADTLDVARKPPNPFGLHDVHGNLDEWCEDAWHQSYLHAPTDGSAWLDGVAWEHVLRGGSFFRTSGSARSVSRSGWPPDYPVDFLGFRPAASVDTE